MLRDEPWDEAHYTCLEHGHQSASEPCPDCESLVADEDTARDIEATFAQELAPAEATNELMKALRRALDRVHAREDEQMGADLAQRWETR